MIAATLIDELRREIGAGAVLTDPSDLMCYAYDASFETHLRPRPPDAVVRITTAEQVAPVMSLAARSGVPVTPRGAATGQTAGAVALRGGIVLDLSPLNRILEVDADNLQVFVEPGVIHAHLNDELARYRLFFPPDPGSSRMCSVGGMVANNSRGMRALKYGATSEYVLGLDVVLPDGRQIRTGSLESRALHSSSGFDLSKLFAGSEGLLGVIVRLRLKVLPLPEARAMVIGLFDRIEDVGRATVAVFRAGILPSAAEVLDARCIEAANLYRPNLNLPAAAGMLVVELDGNPPGTAYDAERVADAIRPFASQVEAATDKVRISRLWEARSVVGAAVGLIRPGGIRAYAGEDICVPITKTAEALARIQEIGDRHRIPIASYGHIGGGTVHSGLVADLTDPDEVRRVEAVADEIHYLALALGGTVTGEHGVGYVRAAYMRAEHGPALDVMRQVKRALDPQGLLNPGKVFLD